MLSVHHRRDSPSRASCPVPPLRHTELFFEARFETLQIYRNPWLRAFRSRPKILHRPCDGWSSSRARSRNGRCGRRPFKKRTADIAAAFEKIGETRSRNSQVTDIARATNADVTPAGEKFCEILRHASAHHTLNLRTRHSSPSPILFQAAT